jgi:hypothetical protein
VQHSLRLGGPLGDQSAGASIGPDGSLYVTGGLASFTGSFSFASGDQAFDRTGSGSSDGYLAVYGTGTAAGTCPPPDLVARPTTADTTPVVGPRFTG